MSEQTLRAVQDAILAHLKDVNCEQHADVILNDWIAGYGGMVPDPDVPGGVSHFSGYMTGADATPQSSMGLAALVLEQMKDTMCHTCTCD